MTRTLGDCPYRPAREQAMLDLLEIQARMDLVDLAQHARDRRAEREDIELGWLDVGGEA